MTRRLQELSEQPLETCDVYFLLDFLHNIYTRYTYLWDWDIEVGKDRDQDLGLRSLLV